MDRDVKDRGEGRSWLVVGLIGILCTPMLVNYFLFFQQKVYYQLWPILVITIISLLIVRWQRAPVSEGSAPRWVMWMLFICALALMLLALLYYIPWLAAASWIVFLGIGALQLSAYRKVENIAGIWLLSLFLLRPPYQLILRVMAWAESVSSKMASQMLDYGSIIHVVQGNVLALPDYDFQIDAICNGWISIVSIVATAGVVCVIRNRPLFHSICLLLLSIAVTLIINMSRILMLLGVKLWYDVDLLSGVYQYFFHLFSFLVALALILCSDAVVVFLFAVAEDKIDDRDVLEDSKRGISRLWIKLSSLELSWMLGRLSSSKFASVGRWAYTSLIAVLLLLLTIESATIYYRPKVLGRQFMYGEDKLWKIGKESVVFDRFGWQVVDYTEEKRDFSSIWGALSSTWRLKHNGMTVIMSLDYPFDEWHDVKRCYSNIGWKISNERIITQEPAFKWKASETNMVLPNGDAGYILCSHSDHLGKIVEPKPTEHDHTMLLYRLHPSKMSPPFSSTENKGERTFYQTQCMVATPAPLDEATKEEIRLMYAQFREQTREAIAHRNLQSLKK